MQLIFYLRSSSVALTQSKDAIETEAKDEEGVPSLKASINVAGKSVSEEDPFNEDVFINCLHIVIFFMNRNVKMKFWRLQCMSLSQFHKSKIHTR